MGSWQSCAGQSKEASSVLTMRRGEAGCTGGGDPSREGCPEASVWTRRSWDSKLSLPTRLDVGYTHISRPVPTAANHYPLLIS